VKYGDHLCLIYDDEKDKLHTTIPFIIDGLRNNELVVVLGEDKNRIIDSMKETIDVDEYLQKNQIVFLPKGRVALAKLYEEKF
jgi:hypothetical protein